MHAVQITACSCKVVKLQTPRLPPIICVEKITQPAILRYLIQKHVSCKSTARFLAICSFLNQKRAGTPSLFDPQGELFTLFHN